MRHNDMEELFHEKAILKTRRELLKDGVDARSIRIRNLVLQQKKGNTWVNIKVEDQSPAENEDNRN